MSSETILAELLDKTISDFNNQLTKCKSDEIAYEDLIMRTAEIAGIRKTLKTWIKEYEKDGNMPKTVALFSAFDTYLDVAEKYYQPTGRAYR